MVYVKVSEYLHRSWEPEVLARNNFTGKSNKWTEQRLERVCLVSIQAIELPGMERWARTPGAREGSAGKDRMDAGSRAALLLTTNIQRAIMTERDCKRPVNIKTSQPLLFFFNVLLLMTLEWCSARRQWYFDEQTEETTKMKTFSLLSNSLSPSVLFKREVRLHKLCCLRRFSTSV